MHIWTHLPRGKLEADGMVEHDGHVGQLLKKLDDLGIADNTTDNGANMMTWPDGGSTPFRAEKATVGKAVFGCHACLRVRGGQGGGA
jgi:arylsulfatase A-like enzyme